MRGIGNSCELGPRRFALIRHVVKEASVAATLGEFRNGLGLYSALVIGGIAMNATQLLVIAIIMPTIVRDIGGASFYTWAAMLYTIGSIVGGASTGGGGGRLGARGGYAMGAGIFALGAVG